ncbi:MAG: tetratricopeptide repeat protein [Saprospiraceae bacterium]|nr:tetratricopeptide repeat protein [Saprospiraceae bacterium]
MGSSKNPENPLPYYFIGNMYYIIGETGNSVEYFRKAIEYDSSLIWAYSQLGDALIILDSLDEAEVVLLDGLFRDSTYMPLVNALGGSFLGQEKF